MVLVSRAPNCPVDFGGPGPSTTYNAPKTFKRVISFTNILIFAAFLFGLMLGVKSADHLNSPSVIDGIPPKTGPASVAHTEGDVTNAIARATVLSSFVAWITSLPKPRLAVLTSPAA